MHGQQHAERGQRDRATLEVRGREIAPCVEREPPDDPERGCGRSGGDRRRSPTGAQLHRGHHTRPHVRGTQVHSGCRLPAACGLAAACARRRARAPGARAARLARAATGRPPRRPPACTRRPAAAQAGLLARPRARGGARLRCIRRLAYARAARFEPRDWTLRREYARVLLALGRRADAQRPDGGVAGAQPAPVAASRVRRRGGLTVRNGQLRALCEGAVLAGRRRGTAPATRQG